MMKEKNETKIGKRGFLFSFCPFFMWGTFDAPYVSPTLTYLYFNHKFYCHAKARGILCGLFIR